MSTTRHCVQILYVILKDRFSINNNMTLHCCFCIVSFHSELFLFFTLFFCSIQLVFEHCSRCIVIHLIMIFDYTWYMYFWILVFSWSCLEINLQSDLFCCWYKSVVRGFKLISHFRNTLIVRDGGLISSIEFHIIYIQKVISIFPFYLFKWGYHFLSL